MILKELEIRSFGCLKDARISPEAGLNIRCRPNEAGKTTMIRFIEFMLFGYDRALSGYFPWDGSPMAGALTMETADGCWRIERSHPARGTEKWRIIRVSAGEPLDLPPRAQPGPELLKIDRETFLRTFCITQGDVLFTRTEGLDTALRNLAATGDESVSAEKTEEILREQRKKYQYAGTRTGSGPLFDLRAELARDREEERGLRLETERRLKETRRVKALEEEENAIRDALRALDRERDAARASDAVRTLRQLEELRAARAQRARRPAVSEEQIAAWEAADQAYAEARFATDRGTESAERLQKQWELCRKIAEDAGFTPQAEREILRATGKPHGIRGACVLLWLFAVGFGLAAVLIPFPPLFLAMGAFALGGAAPLFIYRLKRDRILRAYGAANAAQLQKKWENYLESVSGAETARSAEADLAEQRRAEREAQAELDRIKAETRLLSAEEVRAAQIAWGVYKENAGQAEKEIASEKILLGNRTEEEIRALAADADGEITPKTEAAVREEEGALRERLDQTVRALQELHPGDLRALWEKQEALQRKVSEESRREREWTVELEALQTGLRWLEDANTRMNRQFAPRLCERAGEYLALLTDSRYTAPEMDRTYEIRLRTAAGTYPASAFSAGTRDAIYFAFRLAASDLLPQEPLPMILDDPFVNLDETRAAAAFDLLKKAAERRQILYFTCRTGEKSG